MRPKYLFITISFVTAIAVILVMLATGFIPLDTFTKINPQSGARDVPVESVEVQDDAGAFISSTIEPPATQVTLLQDGPSLLESHCARCHSTQRITKIKKSYAEWEKALAQMEAMGVHLDESEKVVLLNYLAAADKP
jgi:hypothetical protein